MYISICVQWLNKFPKFFWSKFQPGDCSSLVLNSWANLSLGVLIKFVLIKKSVYIYYSEVTTPQQWNIWITSIKRDSSRTSIWNKLSNFWPGKKISSIVSLPIWRTVMTNPSRGQSLNYQTTVQSKFNQNNEPNVQSIGIWDRARVTQYGRLLSWECWYLSYDQRCRLLWRENSNSENDSSHRTRPCPPPEN